MKDDNEADRPLNDSHDSIMLVNLMLDTLKYLYDEQKRHDKILSNIPYLLLTPDVSQAFMENMEATKDYLARIEGIIGEMTHTGSV